MADKSVAQQSDELVYDHHGQSVASWTAVVILLVAAAFICLSFPLASQVLLWIGLALVVIGLVAGKVLASNGYGVGRSDVTHLADAPDVANRDEVGIS